MAGRSRVLVRTIVLLVGAWAAIISLPATASAQSARGSFFLQMLRQNPDARVRVSAALRLSELHEADTVDGILQAFSAEHDPTVLAAMLSALGAIGDPRALVTVQGALHHPTPSVASQARRALASLQAAASTPSSPAGGTPAPATTGHPRLLVGLGTVNNQSGVRGPALSTVAQTALRNALQSNGSVQIHTGSAAAAQQAIRAQRLSGHFFDANIQSVQPRSNGVRAAVSIAVSTYPGRVYEFESQTAITISGGSGDSSTIEDDA
jgi:hypothetical protein